MATPGYEGWAALGDVILGGPGKRAEADYPTYYKQAANAQEAGNKALRALEQARIATSQRIARDNLPSAIAGDPLLSQRGDLATAVLGMATGQPNLNTYTDGLGDITDMEIDAQIQQKLEQGDVAGAQTLSAVKTDKVLPEVEAGGKVLFTPATGDLDVTPLGDSALYAEDALAQQRLASARVSNVKADAGGWKPGSGKAPLGSAEVQAKIDWITAQANKKLAEGETPDYVDAWVKDQMVRAGLSLGADFSGVQAGSDTVPLGAPTGPAIGTVMDGYRYKGGDPANPASWEPI